MSDGDDISAASRRLQVAMELHEAGVEMYRARLRREHPDASSVEISRMVRKWLHTRPGAEHGDAMGRPCPDHPLLEAASSSSTTD